MLRRVVAFVFLGATLLTGTHAFAQDQDKQAAQRLFETGRQLREKGDCPGAIRAFNDVLKHGESVGAYLNIAQCQAELGELRKAIEAYDKAVFAARATSDQRVADATEGARQVRTAHPWIMLRVRPDVVDLEGLQILVDDQPVPREEFNGEVFRTRGGRHVVQISASNRESVVLQAKDHETIDVKYEMLHVRGNGSPPPPPPPGADQPTSGGGWGWQRWTGAGLMAASVIPIGLGVGFVVQDVSQESAIETRFINAGCTNPKASHTDCAGIGKDYKDNHTKWNGRMAAAFVPGGLLLIGGFVLFFTAPTAAPSSSTTGRVDVHVAPTPGGAMVFGTF